MSYYDLQATAGRIRQLRLLCGYTQDRAAELLNTDRRLLSHIENGTKGCSVDMLLRLQEVYHVSVDYLLTGKQDIGIAKSVIDDAIKRLTDLRNKL